MSCHCLCSTSSSCFSTKSAKHVLLAGSHATSHQKHCGLSSRGLPLGRSHPDERGIVQEVLGIIYWVAFQSVEIREPQKAKGIFLGGESETEVLNDFIKSCDTCPKPGLFAQIAWI